MKSKSVREKSHYKAKPDNLQGLRWSEIDAAIHDAWLAEEAGAHSDADSIATVTQSLHETRTNAAASSSLNAKPQAQSASPKTLSADANRTSSKKLCHEVGNNLRSIRVEISYVVRLKTCIQSILHGTEISKNLVLFTYILKIYVPSKIYAPASQRLVYTENTK